MLMVTNYGAEKY